MDPKKRNIIIAVAVAAAAILIGVIIFFATRPPKVTVPDITSMTQADAEKKLAEVGLKVGTVKEEEYLVGGFVIETNPAAGASVDKGSAINIVVSKGESLDDKTVPNLIGMTPEEAEKALSTILLIPQAGEQQYSDTVAPGRVCAQSVAQGTKVEVFSTVTYSISLGKEQATVPDVVGKTLAEARDILTKAGLSVDVTNVYDDKVAKDSVVSQSVTKDSKVAKGTTVTLQVSLGKKPANQVAVPNILTYNLADAKKALESAGLKYSYTGDEAGSVISIKPNPGTKVDQGSTVTFELRRPASTAPAAPAAPTNTQSSNTGGQTSTPSQPQQQQPESSDTGFEAKYSKEDCEKIALQFTGAGGQATGEAKNLKTSDLMTGGGTKYYFVDFELGEAKYRVQVDAIDGKVISATERVGNIESIYDSDHKLLTSHEVEE